MVYGQFTCGHWSWSDDGFRLKCASCRMDEIVAQEALDDAHAQGEGLDWSHPAEEVTSWRLY